MPGVVEHQIAQRRRIAADQVTADTDVDAVADVAGIEHGLQAGQADEVALYPDRVAVADDGDAGHLAVAAVAAIGRIGRAAAMVVGDRVLRTDDQAPRRRVLAVPAGVGADAAALVAEVLGRVGAGADGVARDHAGKAHFTGRDQDAVAGVAADRVVRPDPVQRRAGGQMDAGATVAQHGLGAGVQADDVAADDGQQAAFVADIDAVLAVAGDLVADDLVGLDTGQQGGQRADDGVDVVLVQQFQNGVEQILCEGRQRLRGIGDDGDAAAGVRQRAQAIGADADAAVLDLVAAADQLDAGAVEAMHDQAQDLRALRLGADPQPDRLAVAVQHHAVAAAQAAVQHHPALERRNRRTDHDLGDAGVELHGEAVGRVGRRVELFDRGVQRATAIADVADAVAGIVVVRPAGVVNGDQGAGQGGCGQQQWTQQGKTSHRCAPGVRAGPSAEIP